MVALFVDVENSTGILSQLSGSQRTFFERIHVLIARIVDANKGDIERTMGDGAFVVFRGASRADRTRRCLKTMRELRTLFMEEEEKFKLGWGVEPRLVMGAEVAVVEGSVLQSRGREEFTTFGRDIAFAQRVSVVAKKAPSRMAVGPQMAEEVGGDLVPVEAELKGFEGEQTVFFVVDT